MSGERGGKPSASKLEAISLCRRYHSANYEFEWYGERGAAEEGTIRHEHEEKQTPLEDIEDEERVLCAIRARQAIEWCRETLGISGEVSREVRLWWDGKWSGQLDYLEIDGDQAFVADYKMLRGDHKPAELNVQLAAQAALVTKNFDAVLGVGAALVEPFGSPMYTTVSFTREYLSNRGTELTLIVEEAMVDGAPRTAGAAQCKWCAALPFCPEARNKITETLKEFPHE